MIKSSEAWFILKLGTGYLVAIEAISLLSSDPTICVIDPVNYGQYYEQAQRCPALHVPAFTLLIALLDLLREPNWIIALFTVILAGSTIGLWISTHRLWKAGEQQIVAAQKSANAADKSARAAISLELPRIRITPDPVGSVAFKDKESLIVSYLVHQVVFANHGRTRAIPIEIKYGMTFGAALPPEPIYSGSDDFLPDVSFDPKPEPPALHTTPKRHLTDCSVIVPPGGAEQLSCESVFLWFYCCLVYEDFMGEQRELGRCWRLNNNGKKWRPDKTSTYNFDRYGRP